MNAVQTLALARHTGYFASERRTSWRVCFSGTSIDPAIKYDEISTLCFASSVPLSHQGRAALTSLPPSRESGFNFPLPSQESGLNFPLPSWERDRGRGVIEQLGFYIFSSRINRRSSPPARAQTNGMVSACVSTFCDVSPYNRQTTNPSEAISVKRRSNSIIALH